MEDQILNVKWSIFDIKLDEEKARDLIYDQHFLSDVILLLLDKEAVEKSWDIMLESEGLREKLEKHYEKMGYSSNFIKPFLDKLN